MLILLLEGSSVSTWFFDRKHKLVSSLPCDTLQEYFHDT